MRDQVVDADAVLTRWWAELRDEPLLADLVGVVPQDRAVGIADAMWLLPAVLGALGDADRQLVMLDAAARAYVRAAGLHLMEE